MAPALLDADGACTHKRAELVVSISAMRNQVAPYLGPGQAVILSLPNGPALVTAFAALRSLGVAVALADASSPAEELEVAAEALGTRAIVANPERLSSSCLAWGDTVAALALRSPASATPLPDGTALLKLTSGSTGVPRAIAVGVRELAADTVQIMRTMALRPDDITLAAIPMTHSYGIGSCLVPLLLVGMPMAFPTCPLPAALAHTLARAQVAH